MPAARSGPSTIVNRSRMRWPRPTIGRARRRATSRSGRSPGPAAPGGIPSRPPPVRRGPGHQSAAELGDAGAAGPEAADAEPDVDASPDDDASPFEPASFALSLSLSFVQAGAAVSSDDPSLFALVPADVVARRSFFAQPEPLKWIVGAVTAFRTGAASQTGQVSGPAAVTEWMTSNRWPFGQR